MVPSVPVTLALRRSTDAESNAQVMDPLMSPAAKVAVVQRSMPADRVLDLAETTDGSAPASERHRWTA